METTRPSRMPITPLGRKSRAGGYLHQSEIDNQQKETIKKFTIFPGLSNFDPEAKRTQKWQNVAFLTLVLKIEHSFFCTRKKIWVDLLNSVVIFLYKMGDLVNFLKNQHPIYWCFNFIENFCKIVYEIHQNLIFFYFLLRVFVYSHS